MARRRIALDILEEHFEELDFLWEQRERRIFSPDWTLAQLADHEDRCEAHLDGLRIGAEHSVTIARPFLAGEETGAATAAGLIFLAMESPELAGEVLDTIVSAKDEVRTGVRIALRHSSVRLVTDRLYAFAIDRDAKLRVLAADVLAFHGLKPPPELEELFAHEEAQIRRLAYGAAGRMNGVLTVRHVEDAVRSDDPQLRRIALEAAARAGLSEVLAICRKAAQGARPVAEAVRFLGVIGTGEDLPAIRRALREPPLAMAAIEALGALGDSAGVPLLLEAMASAELAERAAAAFARITGITDVQLEKPVGTSARDEEDDETSLIDAVRASSAWERAKRSFTPNRRWQQGKDIASIGLAAAMATVSLQSRRDLYLAARVNGESPTSHVELEGMVKRRTNKPSVRSTGSRP